MLTLPFGHACDHLRAGANGDTREGKKGSPHCHRGRRRRSTRRGRAHRAGANGKAEACARQNPSRAPKRKARRSGRRAPHHQPPGTGSPFRVSMRYLLDVNVLVAAMVRSHVNHSLVDRWVEGKSIVTCPLSELGFLRVATNSRIYGIRMEAARAALDEFLRSTRAAFIPDDLPALKSEAHTSGQITDLYLAALAAKNKVKLATLDTEIHHDSVEVIS